MVFLITSNTTKIDETDINTNGINDPSRFNNMLSSTFDIAPNSEIAVESVKITRNGNIQLDSSNNQFAVFIGRDLNACGLGLDESYAFPNRTWIRGGNETLNPTDLASRIKYGIYAGLGQHPNFTPSPDNDAINVELKNGSGLFEGFKYTFSQNLSRNASGTNVVHCPAVEGQGGWVATSLTDINVSISASGSKGVVVHKSIGEDEIYGTCSVIGQKYPLSLANGSVVFRYNSSANGSAGDIWEVGLTRATLNEGQADGGTFGRPFFTERAYRSDVRFFDYSVATQYDSATEKFVLKVFDCSYDSSLDGGKGAFVKREINYGTYKPSASFVSVKFIAIGDSIDIDLINSSGVATALITNDNSQTKLQKTKPIGISNYYLFPKVNIYDEHSASRIMEVVDYDGLNLFTPVYESLSNLSFQYGGRIDSGVPVDDGAVIKGNKLTGDLTHQDFWADLYRTGGEGLCRELEARILFDLDSTTQKNRSELNASGGLAHTITIITASDGLFNGRGIPDIAGGYTRDCGAQNIMGFETTPVQSVITYQGVTQGNSVVLESKTTPKMISNKSLFIRLPDLPIESYNTGKGSISKILYHMPRFDNSGNEVGGLYFQPPQRLYIPLNNPNPIRMNNVKVEICNIDETNDNVDLVGQTIICLDIRPKM